MRVGRVIIHELFKPLGSSGAKLSKSSSLMDSTHEEVIQLVDELNKRYRRRDEKQGVFDKQTPTKFHEAFTWFHGNDTDESFIKFTHASSENLRDRIEGIGPAKGGYLVFATYEDYRNYCSIFFVRDTTSIAFQRNKTVSNFDLKKVEHIDFERLAMACRINMTSFSEENQKYLSFIHNKKDDLSKYFINWISSSDTISSEEDTKLLLKALRTIPMPDNPDTNKPFERDEVIRGAHKHILAAFDRNVNLHELSKNVLGDENYIPDFVFKNYPEIPTDFRAHNPTLRQFVKVYVKADNIELNFYPSAFREGKIKFDDVDKSQLIIRSREIVDQIRSSLPE
jgi:nucleoid-associated protein YejK